MDKIQKIINRYPNCKILQDKYSNPAYYNKNNYYEISKCLSDINTSGFKCPDDYNNMVDFFAGGFNKTNFLKYRTVNSNFNLVVGYGTPIITITNSKIDATVKEKDNDYVKSAQNYSTESLLFGMNLPEVLVDPATTLYIGGYTFYSELKGPNRIIAYASDGNTPVYDGTYKTGDIYSQKYDGKTANFYINYVQIATTPLNGIKSESFYIGFDDPLKPKDETFTFESIFCSGIINNPDTVIETTTPQPTNQPNISITDLLNFNLDSVTLKKIENDDDYYNVLLESSTLARNVLNQSSCISGVYNNKIAESDDRKLSDKLVSRLENIISNLTNNKKGLQNKDIINILLGVIVVALLLYIIINYYYKNKK